MAACAVASMANGAMLEPGLNKRIYEMDECRQLIVVTTRSWDAVEAKVRCYARADAKSPWKEALPACDAVTGRHGMAWGVGLHGTFPGYPPPKREGDGRAPAGVFRLNEIFGYASRDDVRITKFPYVQLTASSEAVNDIRSRYYNRIVDASRIKKKEKDWTSSEIMVRPRGLYRWGVVVEHNWKQIPSLGSCIFLHAWLGPGRGTSGCTAMASRDLLALIRWLDASRHPLLVQLPEGEYEGRKGDWRLP
jgi:D-alanyl-D-alanine dipeptidase